MPSSNTQKNRFSVSLSAFMPASPRSPIILIKEIRLALFSYDYDHPRNQSQAVRHAIIEMVNFITHISKILDKHLPDSCYHMLCGLLCSIKKNIAGLNAAENLNFLQIIDTLLSTYRIDMDADLPGEAALGIRSIAHYQRSLFYNAGFDYEKYETKCYELLQENITKCLGLNDNNRPIHKYSKAIEITVNDLKNQSRIDIKYALMILQQTFKLTQFNTHDSAAEKCFKNFIRLRAVAVSPVNNDSQRQIKTLLCEASLVLSGMIIGSIGQFIALPFLAYAISSVAALLIVSSGLLALGLTSYSIFCQNRLPVQMEKFSKLIKANLKLHPVAQALAFEDKSSNNYTLNNVR